MTCAAHALACALLVVVVACMTACRGASTAGTASDPSRVSLARPAGAHGAHMQIVRAMPTQERVALVERFRARNGPSWQITLGGGGAPDDVDAIRGVVRRARRSDTSAGPSAEPNANPRADAEAHADADPDAEPNGGMGPGAGVVDEARAFVARNAEFLGFSPADVLALDVGVQAARTATYGSWVVHFRGTIPMRSYEGFVAVQSQIDLLVYVGDDGSARYFVNLSQVQPRLVLDTTPLLGPDDKRLLRFVVGRIVFVVAADPAHPNARVSELRRIPLGRVEEHDVRRVRLTIHVSPGPRGAYVSYSLAYAVDVVREEQPFRFVVDADTGDLLEDAIVPVVPASPLDE